MSPYVIMERVVQVATRFFEVAGALLLFCMMWLTFVDVIGRNMFNQPVPGGFEITEMMLATAIYCGLPIACFRESHVTVDLLGNIGNERAQFIQQTLIRIIVAAVMFLLGMWLWRKAGQFMKHNEITALLYIPIYPFAFFMSVSAFASSALTVVSIFFPNLAKRRMII